VFVYLASPEFWDIKKVEKAVRYEQREDVLILVGVSYGDGQTGSFLLFLSAGAHPFVKNVTIYGSSIFLLKSTLLWPRELCFVSCMENTKFHNAKKGFVIRFQAKSIRLPISLFYLEISTVSMS